MKIISFLFIFQLTFTPSELYNINEMDRDLIILLLFNLGLILAALIIGVPLLEIISVILNTVARLTLGWAVGLCAIWLLRK